MSDDDVRRRILSAVAEGTLAPQEAADQLHALDHPGEQEPEPAAPRRTPPGEAPMQVRVQASARKVEIIGDPSVREAVAEGRHEAWRDGDTLVIEGEWDHDELRDEFRTTGFNFSRSRSAVIIGQHTSLIVRMNPDLPLEVRVEAGALTTTGVRGPIRARVAAGSARIDGFEGPLDIDVAAGGLKGRGRLDHGHSRIRCDAGSVKVELDRHSSVTISAEAHLGKVDVLGERSNGMLNDSACATIGAGEGALDIDCNLGSVKVTTHG